MYLCIFHLYEVWERQFFHGNIWCMSRYALLCEVYQMDIHFFWLSVLHPSEYIIKINESNDIDAFAYTQKIMPLQIVIVHWMVDQINLLSVNVMKKDLEIGPIHILVSSAAHTTKMCILYTKYVISKRKYMWVISHY